MSERSVGGGGRCVRPLVIGVWLAAAGAAAAEDLGTRPVSWEPRVPMGKGLSPAGRLLINEQPGQPWRAAADEHEVHSRDLLLALPGTAAVVATRAGVELMLWGNLPEQSDFYGLQSGAILHDSRSFDLDLTLRRGRALVTNRKDKGPAHVWLRVEGAAFRLTLGEPGDTVCLGLSSSWPRGVPFVENPRPEDVPARRLNVLVVKGQADFKTGGTQHSLAAPPGPAYFHWDNVNGAEQGPRRRDSLPAWADPRTKLPREAQTLAGVIESYQKEAKGRDPRTALYDLLVAAGDERDKMRAGAMAEFAVFGLAAINDLDRVVQALGDPRQAAARRAAVVALRHWIGDDVGRDQRFRQFLVERLLYPKAQATTVLQLLHTAGPAEEPETYETLIAYLRHEKLTIRQLALWHLLRLVPDGASLPYDPAGSDAERTRGYAAWKELIPSGSLPRPKNPKKK